jgi:hypothetical protein
MFSAKTRKALKKTIIQLQDKVRKTGKPNNITNVWGELFWFQ